MTKLFALIAIGVCILLIVAVARNRARSGASTAPVEAATPTDKGPR
jgi:hypothetical protein